MTRLAQVAKRDTVHIEPRAVTMKSNHLATASSWRGTRDWITTVPGRYYAFISHRWLSAGHPDPEGRQAQFAAWQLMAHLCEAIQVAQLRGLRQPRLQSLTGHSIGAQGSGLAESIIVNVSRRALNSDSLESATVEAANSRELTRDYGVAAAADDQGVGKMRAVLAEHPTIAALLARISIWHDYRCLPQPHRTDQEETLFRQGLKALNPCQFLGITLVLLHDAEDYLTRAWCTLEGLTADSSGSIDTLAGSQRRASLTHGQPSPSAVR